MAGIVLEDLQGPIMAGSFQRMGESLAQFFTQSLTEFLAQSFAQTLTESWEQSLAGVLETFRQETLLSEQRHLKALEEATRVLEKKMEERERARCAQHQELEMRVRQLEECVRTALGKLGVALMRLEERTSAASSRSPPVTPSSSSSNSARSIANLPSAAASIAPRDPDSETAVGEALIKAVRSGQVNQVRRLLHEGANVNFRDSLKQTPLHLASIHSNTDIVSLLLEKGADVNATNSSDSTALHCAVSWDCTGHCVNYLLSAGADISANDILGNTPLHWAATHGKRVVVQALIAAGAEKTVRNSVGQMPYQRTTKHFLRRILLP